MRLFVAVWPPADVLDAIEALDRPARQGVRWTGRDQWHVTLRFLGRVDDVDSVTGPLAGACSLAAPVAVAGPLTGLLGSSIVMLPVGGLDDLAAAVVALTASVGEPPPFTPVHRSPDPGPGSGPRPACQGGGPGRRCPVSSLAGVRGDPGGERSAPFGSPVRGGGPVSTGRLTG